MDSKKSRIKELTQRLNLYRDSYYNDSIPTITDYEYDLLFDELKQLEIETGFQLSNSPTNTVGYEVRSNLTKVEHINPLLSLDKTQDIEEFSKFCTRSSVLLMHKVDGLTVELVYQDGKLIQGSTRGDGFIGEDITHNVRVFGNVPLSIPYGGTRHIIGEAIIPIDNFERINRTLPPEDQYKNPRNLASGTVRQLDSKICAERSPIFICWNANSLSDDNTMITGLYNAQKCGFQIVDFYTPLSSTPDTLSDIIKQLQKDAAGKFIPIDGIVAMYDNIIFGENLGRTSHHFNNGYAFKFYDECEPTKLINVEWTMGKTGTLTPTAVFEPVELEGTTVTRASLHNVSIMQSLNLGVGDTITVYKANQIIPQVRQNLTQSGGLEVPKVCPECGYPTHIEITEDKNKTVKVLVCTNPMCKCRQLKLLSHFVSKHAMNIIGLSEATLSKLIDLKIISNFADIYDLKNHIDTIRTLDGFGETSINNLLNSIENSKHTTLDRFINALSIPSVGRQVAKLLANSINNDASRITELSNMNLTSIDSIGDIMQSDIHTWFKNSENIKQVTKLLEILTFKDVNTTESSNKCLKGKKFVITGKLKHYNNRDALISVIESYGGSVQSSVSNSTTYLINNDINSTTGKNKTAKELNIPIITEEFFLSLIGNPTSELSCNPVQTEPKGKPMKKLF